jgi:hypothetical protein
MPTGKAISDLPSRFDGRVTIYLPNSGGFSFIGRRRYCVRFASGGGDGVVHLWSSWDAARIGHCGAAPEWPINESKAAGRLAWKPSPERAAVGQSRPDIAGMEDPWIYSAPERLEI